MQSFNVQSTCIVYTVQCTVGSLQCVYMQVETLLQPAVRQRCMTKNTLQSFYLQPPTFCTRKNTWQAFKLHHQPTDGSTENAE